MARIARLYRYPVKGMTAERRDRLQVLESGAVRGDRVLGFLLADAGAPDYRFAGGDWWRKQRFAVLMNTPGLARLSARYDHDRRVLEVLDGERLLAEGDVSRDGDRERLASAVTAFVEALDERSLAPGGVLRLIGDGETPHLHDRGPRHVTLMGSASVAALGEALGADVDERRFRMNVVIDGLQPWAELAWIGSAVRLGGLTFDVTGPVVRCLATHANPETGERDLEILQTLTRRLGQEEPTVGVLAVPRTAGDLVEGDEVRTLD